MDPHQRKLFTEKEISDFLNDDKMLNKATALTVIINTELGLVWSALKHEMRRSEQCEMNYQKALGTIEGLKFAIGRIFDNKQTLKMPNGDDYL